MAIPNTLDGELLKRKLRKDYSAYVQHSNPGFCMTKFHKYLCSEIQEFLDTPTDEAMHILLLSVPPRHGKSYCVTETLPSWYLGRNPTGHVIIAAYEGTFAEAFSRRNRDKYNTYAGEIFNQRNRDGEYIHNANPNVNVQGVAMWETEMGGVCRAAGLKGGITGHGAELFIIDDPIKNKESAESEAIITKIHEEMGPSVQSRIHPGGKLIVIQTRWVENDVIGWIERNWSDYIYKTINLPCEYDGLEPCPLGRQLGDALIGEHLGDINVPKIVKNDNNWLKSKKRLVIAGDGERTWNALYQGRPSAQQGNLFNRNWWQTYIRNFGDAPIEGTIRWKDFDYTFLSIDASFKKTEISDMVAMGLIGILKDKIYLWKLINKRMGFVETVNYIKLICKEYRDIDQLLIEDKANGSAIIDTLRYWPDMPSVVGVTPVGGKLARAQAVSPFVSTGVYYVPDDFTESENNDVEWDNQNERLDAKSKFIEQHARFPFMKFDDMVDMNTQALARAIKIITGEEPIGKKRYIKFNKWYPDMWEDYERLNPLEQEEFIARYGAPLEWDDGDIA